MLNVTDRNWVAPRTLNPRSALRLFCFPYAGGAESIYRNWQKLLGPVINVVPMQLPGRGVRMRERLFTDIFPLVEAASQALSPHLDKPFALFGHSMGATIAFEVARKLRRDQGIQPTHLFVSGCCCPQEVGDHYREDLKEEVEIKDTLRRYAGTPPEVLEHPELMGVFEPIIRADFAVCRSYFYSPEPPLDCPVSVFGGLEDPDVGRECLQGWGDQTTRSFRVRMVPGGHFFLNSAESLVVESIARDLHQARL